jgi:lysylphosphatidylglycerol synthase-like protein
VSVLTFARVEAWWIAATAFTRSRRGKIVVGVSWGIIALAFIALAAHHFANVAWPFSHGNPALIVGAGLLFLVAYGFKAYGWRRLFAAHERPEPLALAAAQGGASVTGVALPGRFDDVVRVAIVRRAPGCPAGVRALCLSLFLLGLVDAAAIMPLASVSAALGGPSSAVRAGLSVVAAAGIAAAIVVLLLPRLVGRGRLVRFRLARWIVPRATPARRASEAWALVLACWLVRALALFLLLGALGLGLSFSLALLFLCSGAAAAALPIGPGGAATQAGAGAAILIASGVHASEAVGFAVTAQTLTVLAGAAVLAFAAAWHGGRRLAFRPV